MCVFYTRDLEYLYHYTEYPAIYEKDRIRESFGNPKPGESPEETASRSAQDFRDLQQSAFFRVWACAAVDEILSALHRRLLLGSV